MNRSMLKRSLKQVLLWSGVVVLSAVVAYAQDPAAASGQRSDGQIEMDVVHALDASQALKNDLITAATIQSEVTLAGTVSTDASKKLAESIVTKVPGVTKVHNNLTIGNPQDAQNGPAPQPADDNDQGAQQQANAQPDNGPEPPPQAYPQKPSPDQGQYSQPGPPPGQNPDQGQYSQPAPPQQGQYPPPYPPARPRYGYPPPQQQQGYNQPPAPSYKPATGPITIPSGTLLQLRTSEPLASKRAKDGEPVQFTVISDVTFGGVLAIPRGATVHGVVTESKKAGELSGSPVLALTLNSLDLGGQTYPLSTDEFKVKGPNKAGQTVGNAVGAGIVGTIIGCAVGRGAGCAIGAGAGVAAGTAASAASSGPGVWIPAEALVSFHLKDPLTVNPVSQDEASRLAQGLYQGGPSLYQRPPGPYYPYRPRYAYYGYPYGYYPPVYYRPYYMAGGFYYWR
jgi:hypothetical protein